MNRLFRYACFLVMIAVILIACDKKYENVTGEVELYLLEYYETLEDMGEIDESSVVIEETPLIPYADFKSYNSTSHVFKISDKAKKAVQGMEHSVTGIPFAMVADDLLIYTGYFWPSISSAMCQWIVIDPLMILGDNELRVELGYPGLIEGTEIPDERNNQLILDIFKRDGKLTD